MDEPPWKPLLEELARYGKTSPMAERLHRAAAQNVIQKSIALEIMGEMAESLRRADQKIVTSLLRLEVLEHRIDAAPLGSPERAKHTAEFNAEREKAKHAVWQLRVQREAMGFRRNQELDTLYPVPAKRD